MSAVQDDTGTALSGTERPAGVSAPSLERMFATAAQAFRAAAGEESICERLARADTTCVLEVTDAELGLTALLDRSPIEVVEEVREDAEIVISGPEEPWRQVLCGDRQLGMALAHGELTWTGPVRKVLNIVPILRRAYVNVILDRDPEDDTDQPAGERTGGHPDRDDGRPDENAAGALDGKASERRPAGASAPSLERMFATAAQAFRAAAGEEPICERLARADTTCVLEVTDAELGLTALLDRSPIEVVEEVRQDAEIVISGPEEPWRQVLCGDRQLGMALAHGELTWTGPVRKVLNIVPILRRAYVNVILDRDPEHDTDQPAGERG